MELEEMKATWEVLSKKVEKQERLTDQMIEKMTAQNYRSKLNKIAWPEYIGTLVCYIGAAYLITNFTKIEHLAMQVFGVISIVLLSILPIISLKSIKGMSNLTITTKTYSETLRDYARQKIKFQKLQKWNVALAMFLMVSSLPVLAAIQGKDLSSIPNFWTVIFPLGIAFFVVFARWVLRHYNNVLKEAEEVLSEVNS